MNKETEKLYKEREKRYNDAIALKETDRVPVMSPEGVLPLVLNGATNKDAFYNHQKAIQASVNFFKTHPIIDAAIPQALYSGKSNELAQTNMIDWPGRPGTKVPDFSNHQVQEFEFMTENEYPEILKDYTGFMFRKYFPKAFPGLKGFSCFDINPAFMQGTIPLAPLFAPEAVETYKTLIKMAEEERKVATGNEQLAQEIIELGFPISMDGGGEVPFDIIGDFFRGTLATLTDQIDYEDELEELCYLFADMQIASFQYYKDAGLTVRKCCFPMHKGMDGFMSAKQYEKLYWKPFKKVINALVDMNVVPYLYTEGKYNTRLEQLTDLPKGKCMIHFEIVDMKNAKKTLGSNSCIVGNFPAALLLNGSKEQVVDKVKELLDICAPGGGYIFDFDGSADIGKPENVEAMYEAVEKYGKY